MSDEGTKYYERDGDLYRETQDGPLENYQGGWGKYTGDGFRVRHESSLIDEEEANKIIAENDAHWASLKKKAA